MTLPTRKLFIKSFGCQMNVYDAQRLADVMEADGYSAVERAEDADVVVLNTCHIREKAAEKVYSELGRVREDARERGARPIVAVTGCVAQAEGAEILARAANVDLVVGPQSLHRFADLLKQAQSGQRVVATDLPTAEKFTALPPARAERIAARGVTAFLTVQEGCDKFCSFCVVPYTRGAEYSRPVAQILAEAERLAEGGVRELTLLGQNVNAYRGEGPDGRPWTLAALLERLAALPGIARLRYTTSHPRDMGEDLIAAHRDLPALMPYLHLPVQSGSDRILAAMNRRHSALHYMHLVDRLRWARPDLALSSDFIVGFPGESDADFRATLSLIEQVGYAGAFSFKYSPRPGTPAAEMGDQVPEPVKSERLAVLQDLVRAQAARFNAGMAGKIMDVLVDKPGRHPGQMGGRSPYLQAVHFDAADIAVGSIATVRILVGGPNSLAGERVGSALEAAA